MTLEEIYRNEPLSMRSYHVCKNNGLETLEDIIEFYRKKRSFNELKNCGRRSDEELKGLVNKYKNIDFAFPEILKDKIENKFEIIVSELSRIQREVINSFIQINTNSLSNRSQNGIKCFLENNLKIRNFAHKILLDDTFAVKKIRNVGTRSITELEKYIDTIRDFTIEVGNYESDKYLIYLKNKFLIENTFSLSSIPNEILESESIFQLTNFLINKNVFFNEDQTKIFKQSLTILQNSQIMSLDEIAIDTSKTRERVRQIRKKIIEELFSKLVFTKNFDDDLLEKYNIDNTQCIIEISDIQVETINSQNQTNFTKVFITYLIYAYWSDNYNIVGDYEDVLTSNDFNSRNRHNWNNFYLVKKELVLEFDFISLANDISARLNERLEETYSFSFKSYLSNFLINDNLEILNSIIEITERILNQEFGIFIDLEDNLIFERNSVKTLPEYIFDALEEIGKPSTVDEIYNFIENKNPGVSKSSDALRGSCQRSDSLIYFGRTSTYGLKKWEFEMKNIKGGTIRSIAEEFLSNYTVPMNIKDIAQFVLQYRPESNEKSIIYNLKMEDNNRFLFFKKSFIGLKSKKYNLDEYSLLSDNAKKTTRTWEENYQELSSFILKNNKLPASLSCPLEEIRIRSWLYTQKSKINRGLLDNSKTELINEITSNFNLRDNKATLLRNDGYRKLKEFIEKEKRLPSANKNEESQLYAFFYKQRKLYEDSKLGIDEELKFIEIAKTIQNLKYENQRN